MIIKLNDSYYIDQDDLCYTLKTVKTSYGSGNHKSELPKMRTVVCGYFMTLENALRRFAELQVRDGLETTECDCAEVADRIRTIMNHATRKVKP